MDAAELVQRGRNPGGMADRHEFTLERGKAVEKLREFTLRHPRQYVLELVQAAVFAGATWVAIDVRPRSVLVGWTGGASIDGDALAGLLDYLFVDHGDPATRHLVQLAVAVNALLQRRPRVLRIESGDGTPVGTVRVDLDRKGRGVVGHPEHPLAGTYLYVEQAGAWLDRFHDGALLPEQSLVETRCRYSPIPILLNGDAPFGFRGLQRIPAIGAVAVERFDLPEVRGFLSVVSDRLGGADGLDVVVGGVFLTTLVVPELGRTPSGRDHALRGVLVADSLRKTADQGDLVRDERYWRMVEVLRPYAERLQRRVPAAGLTLDPIPDSASRGGAVAAPVDPPAPEPVELPEQVTAPGPRPSVALAFLPELPRPLFRVDPDAGAELLEAVDPLRFPWPVLSLSGAEAEAVQLAWPEVEVARLADPGDVDFVRRALRRAERLRTVALPLDGGGEVVLTLYVEGTPPAWAGADDGLPALMEHAGVTVRLGALPVELPWVTARVPAGREDEALHACTRGAWRLALDEDVTPNPRLWELRAALLRAARPWFVGRGDRVTAELGLPDGWDRRLLDQPIASSRGEPLSAADVLALAGTGRTVPLDAGSRALDALEEVVGYGHLETPGLATWPVAVVGWIGGRWLSLTTNEPGSVARQLAWVGGTVRAPTRSGWERAPCEVPGVVVEVRSDAAGPRGPLRDGLLALYEVLVGVLLSEIDGPEAERIRGRARLAALHLGRHLGVLGRDAILPPVVPGACVRPRDGLRVVARGGVGVVEDDTVALTLDELLVVREAFDVTLRTDDDPGVWSTDAPTGGWLLRSAVHASGLEGWLGLRFPHDSTATVVLRTPGGPHVLPLLEGVAPCHGSLRADARVLSGSQEQILLLTAQQLFEALLPLLTESEPEVRDAASAYAATYVLLEQQRRGALGHTARALADAAQVPAADGAVWGTVADWVHASDPPTLPWRLHLPAVTAVALPVHVGTDELSSDLEERLQGLLDLLLGSDELTVVVEVVSGLPLVPVALGRRESSVGLVLLRLSRTHPMVYRATWDHGEVRDMLVLEALRRVARWLGPRARLEDLHRVFVAQRIRAR